MSTDERRTESILLKERRGNLITNKVTEGKYIKVTGKDLYVNRNLYAVMQNSLVSNSLVSANAANANLPTQITLNPMSQPQLRQIKLHLLWKTLHDMTLVSVSGTPVA